MRCGEEWRERGLGVLFECEEEWRAGNDLPESTGVDIRRERDSGTQIEYIVYYRA